MYNCTFTNIKTLSNNKEQKNIFNILQIEYSKTSMLSMDELSIGLRKRTTA